MKKEDFVIGKWYVSEHFVNTIAIKFKGFGQNSIEFVLSSEFIQKRKGVITYNYDDGAIFNNTYSSYKEVSISEIQEYLPEHHPDLKFVDELKFVDKLQKFPEEGYCQCLGNNQIVLSKYLRKIKQNNQCNVISSTIGIAWNKFSYWDVSVNSSKKEYTIEQLNKFINTKTEENVRQNTNNEVQSITSENRRSSGTGTVAIRHRGQQITVGIRPEGNSTCYNRRDTKVISYEIKKNIVIRRNS